MKKATLILAMALLPLTQLFAQENIFSLQYSVGFGVGDLHKFISKTSWRGVNLEYRKLVHDGHVGIGFDLGWNGWYEHPGYITTTQGTQSLSGDQFRYCSTAPMLGSIDYYFQPGSQINPFAGLGIGTEYSYSEVQLGIWSISTDTWHFLLKPEVGVLIQPTPGVGVTVSAKYYNAFKTQEVETRSYVGLNVGVAWTY